MHNSLIAINDATPYQALFGRQPALLPPLEGGYYEYPDQPQQGPSHELFTIGQREVSRVREIAAASIIEAIAKHRLERADRHKTHPAMQLSEYEDGQLVHIWYEPNTKDSSGWRGPAQIASVQADDGQVTVRFQGRTLDRRNQEVRVHIPYPVYAVGLFGHKAAALEQFVKYLLRPWIRATRLLALPSTPTDGPYRHSRDRIVDDGFYETLCWWQVNVSISNMWYWCVLLGTLRNYRCFDLWANTRTRGCSCGYAVSSRICI